MLLMIYSIISFICRSGRVEDLEELVIHVVGARKAEVQLAKSWLLIPARLHNLRLE